MDFNKQIALILHELDTTLHNIDTRQINIAIQLLQEHDRIFLTALGRAGFMGKSFMMRLMHMGKEVYILGETNTPNFTASDLLIICSGSGETNQFIQAAHKAKNLGGKLLLFTAAKGTTLDKLADGTIHLKAPSKNQENSQFQSVQPMASLFEQAILLTGDAMILALMSQASNKDTMFQRHSNLE